MKDKWSHTCYESLRAVMNKYIDAQDMLSQDELTDKARCFFQGLSCGLNDAYEIIQEQISNAERSKNNDDDQNKRI